MTRTVVEVMPGPQAEFVLSDALYPAYLAGRRGGKTSASVIKLVRYMTRNPGAYFMFTVPTLGDVDRILLPKMNEFFGGLYGSLWGWLEKKSQIVFPGHRGENGEGGICFVRPASEPDSLRGPTLAAAAMDEIGTENQEEAFRILQPAVLGGQPGYPHQIWVTSTPRVERKWIKERWQDKVHPLTKEPLPAAHYPVFRARTSDNFHLDESVIATLHAEWEGTPQGRQELEGEFIAVEGLAFEMLRPDVHYIYPPEDVEFVRTVYGMDPGGSSPTAIIEWKMDRLGRKWATDEFYMREADEYDWVQWLADHNAQRVVVDQAISMKELAYWTRRYGILFASARHKTKPSRRNLWFTGLNCAQRKPTIYITPNAPNLWNELLNLRYERPRGHEYNTNEWASGCQDHAFDAGAYGLGDLEMLDVQPLQFRRIA